MWKVRSIQPIVFFNWGLECVLRGEGVITLWGKYSMLGEECVLSRESLNFVGLRKDEVLCLFVWRK